MSGQGKDATAIYVDRLNHQWIVRDGEGNFWAMPQSECSWADRRPFAPSEETSLEPIPGHYRYLLDLPC